jgi:hypothetical protein
MHRPYLPLNYPEAILKMPAACQVSRSGRDYILRSRWDGVLDDTHTRRACTYDTYLLWNYGGHRP